jgi:hypothetical protein
MDLKEQIGREWIGLIWLMVAGSCEHGNEPLGSIKDGEFLDYLRDYQILKMDSAAWS